MNYPCNLIQDLLPLYHDGVCSKESAEIIENHLSECTVCKECLAALGETDKLIIKPENTEHEMKKAASFQAVKKKMFRKQILIVVLSVVILSALLVAVIGVLKNTKQIIVYDDNISVSMMDDSLIGRLEGNFAYNYQIKRVEITAEGENKSYLFFCLNSTKWDTITANDEIFSEYVQCASDRGAEQIDGVFYYTGDFTDIETKNGEELQKIIDSSVLLWSK